MLLRLELYTALYLTIGAAIYLGYKRVIDPEIKQSDTFAKAFTIVFCIVVWPAILILDGTGYVRYWFRCLVIWTLHSRLNSIRRKRMCTFCWGSHGCDKSPGHVEAGDPIHQCGTEVREVGEIDNDWSTNEVAHSRYDESSGMVISGLWGDDDEFLGWAKPEPMTNYGYGRGKQ